MGQIEMRETDERDRMGRKREKTDERNERQR